MATNEHIIKAPGMLKNLAVGGHLTTADQVLDDGLNKDQKVINQERIADDAALDGKITTEKNRAEAAEELLRQAYEALTQSDIVVGTLPASGEETVIYRVPGESSYKDYMWDGTQFVEMAEYDNAIDDEPIVASDNLVKSGGVYMDLLNLYDAFANNEGSISHYGLVNPLSGYLHTDFLYIKSGDEFKARLFYGPTAVASCYVYNKDRLALGEYIPADYESGSTYDTTLVADDIIQQYPGAAYIRLSGMDASKDDDNYPFIKYNIANAQGNINTSLLKAEYKQNKGYVIKNALSSSTAVAVNEAIRTIKFKPPTGKEDHVFAIRVVPKDDQYGDYFYIYDITASNQASFKVGMTTPLTGIFEGVINSDMRTGWEDALLYVNIDFDLLSSYYFVQPEDLNFILINCTGNESDFYLRNAINNLNNRLSLSSKVPLTIIDGYYSNGASLSPNNEWRVVEYDIPDVNGVYWASGSVRPAATRLVDYLNAQGGYISSECFGTGVLTYYEKYPLTVPINAAKLRVTSYMNDEPEVFIGTPSSLEKVNNDLNKRIDGVSANSSNYWTDKYLWWCGTSIPAGSDATLGSDETIAGNYPTEVGENLLCAKLWNKSVGGSMCRANVRTGDYNGANISNITSALSMTNEEVEDFIDNYNTYKALPKNTSWPASLSASDITRLRSASFENRLMPYLLGSVSLDNPNGNTPDLYVIDHGHNDWKYTRSNGASDIGLLPTVENIQSGELAEDTYMTADNYAKLAYFLGYEDGNELVQRIPTGYIDSFVASLNRNCFIGAVNFIITVILSRNAKARIVFISNYEYKNGYYPGYAPVIEAQRTLADDWAFPLCEVYKYLGFSKKIVPNAKEYFEELFADTPSSSIPAAAKTCIDNDKDCFLFQLYNPDNVHPHSDISGDANNVYAGVISEFLKTCR